MMMKIICYLMILVISGCASVWTHENASDSEIKSAYSECVEEGRLNLMPKSPESYGKQQSSGEAIGEAIYIYRYASDCMKKKGYKAK